MSHVVRGDHVFPLDAFCPLGAFAVGVFARLEIATAKVDVLLVVVFAAAVESLLQFAVVYAAQLLARVAVVVVAGRCRRVNARFGDCCENSSEGKCKNSGTAHRLEGVNHISNKK